MGARYISTADLTGDDLPDLVVGAIEIDGNGDGLYWFRNVNNGASWAGPTAIDAALQGVEIALTHDVDSDNVADVIAVGSNSNEITWYENGRAAGVSDNAPTFTKHTIATPPDPYHFSIANLDADPAQELVATSDSGVSWYDPPANPANPWTSNTIDAGFGTATETIYAADFDRDGDADVAVASGTSGLLGWYRNAGDGSWTWQMIQVYGGLNVIAGGDLNGDGRLDLITSTYEQQSGADEIAWWRNGP